MGVVSCLMAAPAASQTQTQAASNQDLTARVAAGAGYDANVFGSNLTAVADDTLPRKGTYVSNDVSLDYSRAGSLDIGATASSGLRLYETDRNYSAQTFSGAALVSGTIASRLHIAVSVEAVRSSQYLFWIFPVTSYGGTVFGLPMPSLNDRITPIFITTYGSDIAASYTLSRRSSLSAEYGVRRSIIRANLPRFDTVMLGGHYSYGFTKYAGLRLGYSTQTGVYRPSRTITRRTIDAGITYARPLSFSRRTKFSFAVNSLGVDDGLNTYATVGGAATLSHQFGRFWKLNGDFDRGVSFIDGFADPVLSNAVSATLKGAFGRRVDLTASSAYSRGKIGLARSLFNDYTSGTATVRTNIAITRRFGLYTEYFYYRYRFNKLVALPAGSPCQLDRNGVSAGLELIVPIIERKRRATR